MSKLREWRRARRMTQGKLASKAGTTTSTVSRIETGLMWPSPDVLANIERATKGAVTVSHMINDYYEAQGVTRRHAAE